MYLCMHACMYVKKRSHTHPKKKEHPRPILLVEDGQKAHPE